MTNDAEITPPQLSLNTTRAKALPLPSSLSIWTGYLLSRLGRQCNDYFDALSIPLGIKGRHFSVLAVIGEENPLSQIEISERLGIDRNTIVLLLDDLEAGELVTRSRDPRDRRAHLLALTPTGQTVLSQGRKLAQRTNDEVLSPLTPEERAELHALLNRLF